MSEARRLMWVGDACCPTGFARVTENVLRHLSARWTVAGVLGVNYRGNPHRMPYDVYPAMLGGDVFGVGRIEELCKRLKPDVVVVNSDPWIVADHLERVPSGVPVVAYMPVDAPNQGAAARLNSLAGCIAYTKFGRKELLLGGYVGETHVVPHGVDLEIYKPTARAAARRRLNAKLLHGQDPESVFIVGSTNRNNPRKHLDLVLMHWTEWWRRAGCPRDAYVYLHCSARGEDGWDLPQLADYLGIGDRLLMSSRNMTHEMAVKEADMPVLYGVFDTMLSLPLGEGWGLTNMEGMACEVAQIVSDYAALGEWPRGAVTYVPVTSHVANWNDVNTIGGVADLEGTVAALDLHYRDPAARRALALAGRALVERPEFRWEAVAARFDEILTAVVEGKRAAAPA